MYSLEPETICDHFVSTETKKLWNIMLDIYSEIKRLCQKHDIKYYAFAGTLLGAARHQGFIPWDDDMDLYMMPEDYMKFLKVAEKELEYPYSLQTCFNDKYIGSLCSRVRRDDTTGCTEWEYKHWHNEGSKGIFVDIFPRYYLNERGIKNTWQKFRLTCIKALQSGFERTERLKSRHDAGLKAKFDPRVLLWQICKHFTSYQKLNIKFVRICSEVKFSDRFGSPLGKRYYLTKWNSKTMDLPFDGTTLPCTAFYDEFLTSVYGNWHAFIKGTSRHQFYVVDPEIPYKDYFKDYYQGKMEKIGGRQ